MSTIVPIDTDERDFNNVWSSRKTFLQLDSNAAHGNDVVELHEVGDQGRTGRRVLLLVVYEEEAGERGMIAAVKLLARVDGKGANTLHVAVKE